ncbi:MAG TPA: septal ring lytic transglycosylase RlpA family protein [Dehalococcoidia bacterium]|nr:septal ring lytic transglycosylase RlpA family protein [Dehalococcoidia bacterium]
MRAIHRTGLTTAAFLILVVSASAPIVIQRTTAAPQELSAGWNMVVYEGPALPPDEAFASLGDALTGVYLQVDADSWLSYVPAFPDAYNSLTLVEPDNVYWLYLSAPATLHPPQRTIVQAVSGLAGSWMQVERGKAVFYGWELAGNRTACGPIFDPTKLTAASNTLPCGTVARVTNVANGKSVIVTVNDTGGFRPPIVIDLSKAAYETIAPPNSGEITVTIEVQQ